MEKKSIRYAKFYYFYGAEKEEILLYLYLNLKQQ